LTRKESRENISGTIGRTGVRGKRVTGVRLQFGVRLSPGVAVIFARNASLARADLRSSRCAEKPGKGKIDETREDGLHVYRNKAEEWPAQPPPIASGDGCARANEFFP
jgi:hypothetical protein